MAASSNPSGGHSKGNANGGEPDDKTNGGATSCNGVEYSASESQHALRHNPGISLEWSQEEQSTLEDLLTKYASESNIVRYAKISQGLKGKTVRDVALRCRWMNKKENGKRKKDDHNSSRKNKDKKEKVADPMPKTAGVANGSNDPPYVQSMMSMDSDDGVSYEAIGGAAGQLLEQNAQALDQIFANFSAFKIHENINLFCQARTNILSVLNDFNDTPEIMKQMPPLPVKLNEELANSILPPKPPSEKS